MSSAREISSFRNIEAVRSLQVGLL